jgi:predicted permease
MKTGISWLDVKLGIRMLVKYPGLTLVGGVGMAVAFAVGAGSFTFFYSHLYPNIPLEDGHRIVAVENWDTKRNNEERRALHDFATWRRELKSVQDLGAFRNTMRNLIAPGGPAEAVKIAEMTASGFRVARVRPLMGRYLVPEDEREGAPRVLVIGYDVWKTRFGADAGIVGRDIRLGNVVHTVVGVMPERFAFPVSHQYWTALQVDPTGFEQRRGPAIHVFGRLAPGVTAEQAQAELSTIGRRAAAAHPKTHAFLRPQILPYTYPLMDIQDVGLAEVGLMQLTMSMLLVVVAVNVAILVYARTATRLGEIAVRTALGASRRRVVAQLFVEALVLSSIAALIGLGVAQYGLRMANAIMDSESGGAPFWVDYGLSFATVAYTVGLTLLAALIVGVLPALQSTGRRLTDSLRQLGGGTGMRLGRVWTILIVTQVALAVAALPVAVAMGWKEVRSAGTRPTFAAQEFIAAPVVLDAEKPEDADAAVYADERRARFATLQAELARQLEAEPGVAGVTFSAGYPGGEGSRIVEVEGGKPPAGAAGHEVGYNWVEPDFFDVFGAPVLTGRRFAPADQTDEATAVIVNRSFVRQVLGGGSALGRRVRYASQPDDDGESMPARWFEIVGVVGDLHENPMDPGLAGARMYHPLTPGSSAGAVLAVRMPDGVPESFGGRLRDLAAGVDAALRLGQVESLETVNQQAQLALRLVGVILTLVIASVLLLSAAGIYALMSFTVSQRRKEIGIRSALGAHPRRLLAGIFARALRQLGLGLGVGLGGAALVHQSTGGDLLGESGLVLLPIFGAVMLVVGLLAALGPARRGLRIQPSEALRAQ